MTTKETICDRHRGVGRRRRGGGNERVKQQTDQLARIKKKIMKNYI